MELTKKKLNFNAKQDKLTVSDFEFGKYLGEGGYGKVYHARKRTGSDNGTVCAMKVMDKTKILKSKKKIENVKSERAILASLEHPFIVSLLYAFETKDSFYLGLEFLDGGDLFEYLEKVEVLPEERARLYTAEIILALKYLHENLIVYRDLKPDNILLDADGHVKLTDFGLSKKLFSVTDKTYTFCGTLDYMSPEMILKYPCTSAVDWWSVGVLLFDMLTGCPPFTIENDREQTMRNIRFAKFSFTKSKAYVSMKAKDLIFKLLKINPRDRLGFGPGGAIDVMYHSFFNSINWDNILARRFEPLTKKTDETSNFEKDYEMIVNVTNDLTLSEPDKYVFEDFDYTSPNLSANTLATHVKIPTQDHRKSDYMHMYDRSNAIFLIDQAIHSVKF